MAAKKKKTSENKSQASQRKILYAPWRYSYIKSASKEDEKGECVFCASIKKGPSLESLIVYKGTHASVILNKFPYNNGHIMIIPHSHTAEIDELGAEEFMEVHALLKKAHGALQEAYNPHGMNIGMNLGRVAGAGIVDHLHYHLVPRWGGDTNFMPVIGGTKVISESVEQTYQKLLPLFT
jgi:ATP adenylyltransferase